MVGRKFKIEGVIYTILERQITDHPYDLRLEWISKKSQSYHNEPYNIDSIKEWLKQGEINKIIEVW